MGERVEWSNLPRDLLVMIGKSLDARVDVLRFRGVCTSWRSSIPSFHAHSPRFPLKFPEPFSALESASMLRVPQPQLYLCESTLYLLQPENPFPTSSSSCCNKGWLIKVQESNSGKLHLLDPLPSHKYRFSPVPPNTLNLLNFRVVELRKAHMLGFHVPTPRRSETERSSALSYRSVPWVNKVVMIPSSAWTDADESAVFVIFSDGKLAFAKFGDEKWTLVGDASVEYDDIIVYKGQFYVVDILGNVSWIRCSSLELVPFSPPLCGLGNQKHLVESCGALYVFDRYLDRERRTIVNYVTQPCFPKTVDFKVYKLDEEECGWVLLRSLGDRAFVLSTDWCLSVLAQEFAGCKGNCIYFFDQHETHVFSLEDSSFADFEFSMDDSHLFWEAPTWLTSANP